MNAGMQSSSSDFSNPWIDDAYWPGPYEEDPLEGIRALKKALKTLGTPTVSAGERFIEAIGSAKKPPVFFSTTGPVAKRSFDRRGRKTR